MSCRDCNDTILKLQYKRYCKMLTNVIRTEKKRLLSKSKNKTKTTWKIIKKKKKKEIGNNNCQNYIKSLKINNTITNNPQETANTFNDYFLTVADTAIGNIKKYNNDLGDNVNLSNYLINNFSSTFP